MNTVRVNKATEEDFRLLQDEWRSLLCDCDNNSLFNSWEWQYHWWKTWSSELGLKLQLLLARNDAGKLCGIAPLYCYTEKHFGGLFTVNRLQFIGCSANISATVRSEYLTFIFKRECGDIVNKLLDAIDRDKNWSMMHLSDMLTSSYFFAYLMSVQGISGKYYIRATLKDVGVKIDTTQDFNLYKDSIGKSIRLDSFNRFERLTKLGNLNNTASTLSKGLRLINEFHIKRWHKRCFNDKALEFHEGLKEYDGLREGINFSQINLDSVPISVIYNIDYNGVRYNLQMGFGELPDKKLSLGYLQLGKSIQEAFASCKVKVFDLLAGSGKNSFYKERYKGEQYRLYSLQIIRSKRLIILYKSYDMIKYFFFLRKKSK